MRRDDADRAASETGDSLVDAISRATAPVTAQLSANHTWRNWGGVLLIMAGLTGALGLSVLGALAPPVALSAGVGSGLAMLRWGPGGD